MEIIIKNHYRKVIRYYANYSQQDLKFTHKTYEIEGFNEKEEGDIHSEYVTVTIKNITEELN